MSRIASRKSTDKSNRKGSRSTLSPLNSNENLLDDKGSQDNNNIASNFTSESVLNRVDSSSSSSKINNEVTLFKVKNLEVDSLDPSVFDISDCQITDMTQY